MHGGRSTGPRTLEGRERSTRAQWKHGSYSAEAEREFRRLKAECAAFNALQQARHAALFARMRLLANARRRLWLARGATEPIVSKQTAERVWEPKFLAEIMAGRDPHVTPNTQPAAAHLTVSDFLDCYFTNYVETEALSDPVTVKGRLKAIKKSLGDLPVTALEKPEEILRFIGEYRQGREIATVTRALSTLRAAINWGRFQDPPYLTTTPFHRFGVSIKTKEETERDRRIGRQEEQALLTACSEMNAAEHKFPDISTNNPCPLPLMVEERSFSVANPVLSQAGVPRSIVG